MREKLRKESERVRKGETKRNRETGKAGGSEREKQKEIYLFITTVNNFRLFDADAVAPYEWLTSNSWFSPVTEPRLIVSAATSDQYKVRFGL